MCDHNGNHAHLWAPSQKTGNLNVKSGSPVCWAWRVGSPRCFWVLALSWPVAPVPGLVGSPAVRLLCSVLFWRASPGRSCFCCVAAQPPKLAFPLDVWQCRSPSILVAPFLGTQMRECQCVYYFGHAFQNEEQRTVLVARAGLDCEENCKVIKKV